MIELYILIMYFSMLTEALLCKQSITKTYNPIIGITVSIQLYKES